MLQQYEHGDPPWLSILIPTYEDDVRLAQFLEHLAERLPEHWNERIEVIVVDGARSESCAALVPSEMRYLASEKGRGQQLRLAANEARGAALFIVHVDSVLPEGFALEIESALKRGDAGFFPIRFDDPSILMRICGRMSNVRARGGIVFGDQGLFLTRALYEELGGFEPIPIMEDYELGLRMKRRGIRPIEAQRYLITSARRFLQGGKLRTMWRMRVLRFHYRRGVSAERLARAYRAGEGPAEPKNARAEQAERAGCVCENKRSKDALILFTRVPIAGQTKTRMMPQLYGEQCAALHRAFLQDLAQAIAQFRNAHEAALFVSYTPEGAEQQLLPILGTATYLPQVGDDLGARMANAIEQVLGCGYDRVLLFGSDVPELRSSDFSAALDALAHADLVIQPTIDGGYCLISMKRLHQSLFTIRGYGGETARARTKLRAHELGLSVHELRAVADMDTYADLQQLSDRIDAAELPHTAAFLERLEEELRTASNEDEGIWMRRCKKQR